MTKIVLFATSLGQQCDVSTAARIAHSTQGWIRWAQRFCGWRVEVPVWDEPAVIPGWEPSGTPSATRGYWGLNAGVSGQTLDLAAARIAEVAAIPADEYWVEIGTNDVATLSAEAVHAGRMEICRRLAALTGKPVRLMTILYRGVAAWANPSVARTTANAVNLLTMAQTEFKVVDFNEAWFDPSSAVNIPRTGYSNDATHFGAAGAYAVGKLRGLQWAEEFPALPPLVSGPGDPDQLIAGGFMSGTGGTAGTGTTGPVVNLLRAERSTGDVAIVASVTTPAGVRGSAQKLVFTPTAVAGQSRCYFRTNLSDTPHTRPGKWVVGTVKIRINSANNSISGINLYMSDNSATGKIAQDLYDAGVGFPAEATGQFVELRTPPLKLRPDSASIRYRLEIYIDGQGSGPADIEIAEFFVKEVPDPEAIFDTIAPGALVVAANKSLLTKRGSLAAGAGVRVSDVSGGADRLRELQANGVLTRG